MSSRKSPAQTPSDLVAALLLVTVTWSVLLASGFAVPWTGGEASVLGAFAIAVGLVWSFRPTPTPSRVRKRMGFAMALGFVGYFSLPALVAAAGWAGLGLGWTPRAARPPTAPGFFDLSLFVLLAPVYEELVYRERLLPALERRIGSLASIPASSACFALPHVEAWAVLATFLVGCLLGALYVVTRSFGACLAFHGGLNLAVLISGLPPVRLSLPVAASATLILLTAVLVLLEARRPSPLPGRGSIR